MNTIEDVKRLAAHHNFEYFKTITHEDDDLAHIILMHEPNDSYVHYFGTGWCQDLQQAIDFTIDVLQMDKDKIMNLLKSDKLFPHIKGVMLKNPVTLILSGQVKITETQGGDARLELHFEDHGKTAVINKNQALNIIDAHGSETDNWKGKKVVLFGEEGVWFGKKQWGIRVDAEQTKELANGK